MNQNKITPYQLVMTADGTMTVYSQEYDESMHTISGAYDEAIQKHVIPSNILATNDSCSRSVLDVGFGLGYNTLALVSEFRRHSPNRRLHIYALEKNENIAEIISEIVFNDERDDLYNHVKKLYSKKVITIGQITCHLIFGDARQLLTEIDEPYFDAVFHDPYSPSKNPELWTIEFFISLRTRMSAHAVLTTYSSASHIRMAMLNAGFFIARGPSVGPKKEGTLAYLIPIGNGIPPEDLELLYSNIKAIPFSDPFLNDSGETIVERRRKTIAEHKFN